MRLPWPVPAVAAVEALQGAALASYAGFVGFEAARGNAADSPTAAALAATLTLLGAGVLLVGRGLYLGRRWSRPPAVLTQIFVLPLAGSLLRGGQPGIGLGLAVVAVGALALLFHPEVTRRMARTGPRES